MQKYLMSILHVCGDDPVLYFDANNNRLVFSTYVEMILSNLGSNQITQCILHVCGDDPVSSEGTSQWKGYSPRMWR